MNPAGVLTSLVSNDGLAAVHLVYHPCATDRCSATDPPLSCLCQPCLRVQLVISYYMNANIMCEYGKEEWTTGFTRMNVDSIEKLRSKLQDLRAELREPQRFQDVYNFAFSWAREVRSAGAC